jgi:hypothetical protein
VRYLLISSFFLFSTFTYGQRGSEGEAFLSKLNKLDIAPEGITSSRSFALFSGNFDPNELEDIQRGFQPLGVDPIGYVESDRPLAGYDMIITFSRYLRKRQVRFLIFLQKKTDQFEMSVLTYNKQANWAAPGQSAWVVQSNSIRGLIELVKRAVISTQKRTNFLVNGFPEKVSMLKSIPGDRNETMAPNLRSLRIAVPRFGDSQMDIELETFLRDNFKVKYELVDAGLSDKELQDKGFIYVLRYLHAPGAIVKSMLGYDMSQSESALASVNYNTEGTMQIKTIPSNEPVYKFYVRHIEYERYYLGLKWDADTTWKEALKNHIDGYRVARQIY